MQIILKTLFALILFGAAHSAAAQPAGQEAPAFKQAVEAWLDNDDQTALPALAKLAREDNRAAQILLGRIATRPMGPWLAGLERKERMTLLRAPGGLSGTSWLKVAAEAGEPLAQLFLDAVDPRAGKDTVRALAEAGETMSAARLSQHFWSRKGTYPHDLMLSLWRKGALPSEFAIHFSGQALKDGALSDSEILRLQNEAPFPTNRIIEAGLATGASTAEAWRQVIADWYEAVGARKDKQEFSARGYHAEPVEMRILATKHICDRSCGRDTNYAIFCTAIATRIGPRPASMMRLATPLETLISQSDFAHTPRAELELQNMLQNDASMRAYMNAKRGRLPSCITSALGFD